MNSGSSPGPIPNSALLLDSKEFYHNRKHQSIYTNTPLREELQVGRDYFLICKGIWEFLFRLYGGTEIIRYTVLKGPRFPIRTAELIKLKTCLMRRGEHIKYPKFVILGKKSTVMDLKRHVRTLFPHLNQVSSSDMRVWSLKRELTLREFIESFNQGIASNVRDKLLTFYSSPILSIFQVSLWKIDSTVS